MKTRASPISQWTPLTTRLSTQPRISGEEPHLDSTVVVQVVVSGRRSTRERPGRSWRVAGYPRACWVVSDWMSRARTRTSSTRKWKWAPAPARAGKSLWSAAADQEQLPVRVHRHQHLRVVHRLLHRPQRQSIPRNPESGDPMTKVKPGA